MKTTTRKILVYTLDITVPKHEINLGQDPLMEIFNFLVKRLKDGDDDKKLIYNRQGGDKDTFMTNIIDDNYITGKIIRLRSDLWPQVMDTETSELSDLILPDNKEVVESSHFQIRKDKHGYKILFEYNHYGAKINHFIELLTLLGKEIYSFISLAVIPVQVEYDTFIDEIVDISELSVEIVKNNIMRVEDPNLIEALKAASKAFDTNVINLKWTLDESLLDNAKQFLGKLFNKNGDNPYSRVKVYSKKQGARLQWFDLMEIRTSYQVRPNLRAKRVLDSKDMFMKIKAIDL